MTVRFLSVCCLLFFLWVLSPVRNYAQEFELEDGDRVVFVGDGFIERAQRFGYVEAALSAQWPNRTITFRNVGWSGDTVKGEARDHYTNPPTAYEHLLEQIEESDPTVLIMGYGGYLAFEAASSFEDFRTGYRTLLDDVKAEGRRCILLSPIPHEQRSSPLPDVSAFNRNLEKATELISEIAQDNSCTFVDLFTSLAGFLDNTTEPISTNGIHLTAFGYSLVGELLGRAPQMESSKQLVIDLEKGTADGGRLIHVQDNENEWTVTLTPSHLSSVGTRALAIQGLPRGTYQVSASSTIIGAMKASEWQSGTVVIIPDEYEQADQLRAEIIDKNALYFRKYRPQNETYLVGFRNYEQGQNAVELDLLDPLIHEKENEIGRLKIPQPITLTIERL